MQRSANLLLRRVNDFLSPGPAPSEGPLPLPDHLIALPSREGVALLVGSLLGDYLRLSAHYVPQESPKFCGPATIAICLNALDLAPPEGAGWPKFTQRNIFTPGTDAVRTQDAVAREGMGLAVLADFVTAHGGRPEVRFAEHGSLEEFRAIACEVLADPQRHLAVNYLRPALGQEGRGHTSPLVAYDAASDRFLVLDTSLVRYPPVWARAEDLFAAMNTRAGAHTRGFAIVGRA
ncbi:MAG: phytochelatin synthase family protein [Amaricoccus sp.]|uniref:phytochelatin synthase family protein n=1 Tax=Amaricoccus sp. TaxID=1872485 RepID=UPI0039E6BDBE